MENLDSISLSTEGLQNFLDVFYEDLIKERSYSKKKGSRYNYHDGNNVKKIKSIRLNKCLVCSKDKNNKLDMVVVRYFNDDNILCCFNILLDKLKDFELHGANSPYKKKLKLPKI
jgi:hypothetical protein